jgi:signal transduction histidine kinase
MSFAKPRADADMSELGRLYANLSNGMHTMAQPLTVLRSAVAACAMPGLTEEARQFYLNVSSEQVERACAQFQSMQELLIAIQNPADCAPIDLSELLAALAESQKEICGESGVRIEIVASETLRPILGDKERTLQSLVAVLRIAVSLSKSGDTVALLVTSRMSTIALIVQNKHTHGRNLSSSERLSLSVAETNILSQSGSYELTPDPFRVTLTLPIQDVDSTIDKDPLHDDSAVQCR